jgi:hypothetical protein
MRKMKLQMLWPRIKVTGHWIRVYTYLLTDN